MFLSDQPQKTIQEAEANYLQDLQVEVAIGQETFTVSWESGYAWLHTTGGLKVALTHEDGGDTRWVSFWEGGILAVGYEVRVYLDGRVQRV